MLIADAPRVQPHDLAAERALLGAILIDPSALPKAQEIVTSRDFYDSSHRCIFEAMIELTGRSEMIDLITLADQLASYKQREILRPSAVADLLIAVGSAANIGHHAKIVREHSTRRQLIRFTAVISQNAYDTAPIEELLQQAERDLFAISLGRADRAWASMREISSETVAYVDQLSKRTEEVLGISSGFPSLDTLLGGWQRSDLIIIAARPSMGKTSLALGSGLAAAHAGYRVGLLSLEMSRLQLGIRLHGMGAPIDVHRLKSGRLSPEGWFQFANAAERLESLPLYIDDSALLTVEQVCVKARHLKALHGLDLLVVDYLQLFHLIHAESRQQGIAEASRKLKLLAKELDIPIIVLSQLSRDCDRRDDQRPMLSDLRDSGVIEQDADVVMFIYREEVYRRETDEKGIAEILVRKHRNGPIGDRRLKFVDRFARFEELAEE